MRTEDQQEVGGHLSWVGTWQRVGLSIPLYSPGVIPQAVPQGFVKEDHAEGRGLFPGPLSASLGFSVATGYRKQAFESLLGGTSELISIHTATWRGGVLKENEGEET